MTTDCLNVWSAIASIVKVAGKPEMFEFFADLASQDLQTYEEYTRRANGAHPDYAEQLIRDTDPAKLKRFNELVTEFNANRERIIKEKDVAMAQRICTEAETVVRNPK